MFDIPCVIFAGGKSSRMGEDKALLPFGDFSTLAEFQFHRLSKLFQNIYISCKTKEKFPFNADFIEDISSEELYAPTAGFVTVFEKLKCEKFFAISVDTPFIDIDTIETLLNNDRADVDATIAKSASGTHPLVGIYHNSLKEKFEQMMNEDNHKLGFLLKKSQTNYLFFEDEKPFLNLNHPNEYQEALKLL